MHLKLVPLLFLPVAACDTPARRQPAGERVEQPALDAIDSTLRLPRVVRGAAVVVFWLAASDTLHPADAAAAYEGLTLATERIVPSLSPFQIALLPTHADTIFLELPDRRRRSILLSGLEFPFGFVLMEPGSAERVLSGPFGEAELLDEIRVYFDLPEDSTGAPARVLTE